MRDFIYSNYTMVKRKTTKRKVTKKKATKRKVTKKKATKRKSPKGKIAKPTKRKITKKKATKRKSPKGKIAKPTKRKVTKQINYKGGKSIMCCPYSGIPVPPIPDFGPKLDKFSKGIEHIISNILYETS
jgi:hypothetical protein